MNRREFIRKAGLAAGGLFAAPYILPAGTLFAPTGNRIANHVVVCLFAGGVRNIESIKMADGNLMPHTLTGAQQISADILPGMTTLPGRKGAALQTQGTLFKEFRFNKGPTGHVNGLVTAVTGAYYRNGVSAKTNPPLPTVFEYYRKHSQPEGQALNAWWIADRLDPFFFFNYSRHDEYGPQYGANFMQPATILSNRGYHSLSDYQPLQKGENEALGKLGGFLDQKFSQPGVQRLDGVKNTPEEAAKLEAFVRKSMQAANQGDYDDPLGIGKAAMNQDFYNLFFAEKILQEFQPELLFVNMLEIDKGHTDFTLYCNNMRKADLALAHLWQTIQSTPGLANDTILIAVPEHGRNLKSNTLKDRYGRFALDHTNDPTSREIFCLVLGPPDKVKQNQVIAQVRGESIDVVPTVAHILGFHQNIPEIMLQGKPLLEAFV